MKKFTMAVIFVAMSIPCMAKGGNGYRHGLQITATTEQIAAITEEILGRYGTVKHIVAGDKNPYRYEPREADVLTLRKSELIVCNGLGLESQWLPEVLYAADKKDTGMNFLDIAKAMSIEKPNAYAPQFLLSKDYVLSAASIIADRLGKLDQSHTDYYREKLETFRKRITEKVIADSSIQNALVISYDSEIASVIEKTGITSVICVRQNPLTELGVSELDDLVQKAKQAGAKAIIADTWTPTFVVKMLETKTRLPVILIPLSVNSGKGSGNIFKLLNTIQERIKSIPANS